MTIKNFYFQKYGIPNHCGLYYAMGSALAMEGIMSASYHVCPNHSNFQFGNYINYSIECIIILISCKFDFRYQFYVHYMYVKYDKNLPN